MYPLRVCLVTRYQLIVVENGYFAQIPPVIAQIKPKTSLKYPKSDA